MTHTEDSCKSTVAGVQQAAVVARVRFDSRGCHSFIREVCVKVRKKSAGSLVQNEVQLNFLAVPHPLYVHRGDERWLQPCLSTSFFVAYHERLKVRASSSFMHGLVVPSCCC